MYQPAASAVPPAKRAKSDVPANGDRRKGVPWTEEEHRLFLLGLAKFGKGDWRNIARNFVVSRTPTQVRRCTSAPAGGGVRGGDGTCGRCTGRAVRPLAHPVT